MSAMPQFGMSCLAKATVLVAIGFAFYTSPFSTLFTVTGLVLFGFTTHVLATVTMYQIRRWWPRDPSNLPSEIRNP